MIRNHISYCEAEKLRRAGNSYREISKKLNIPKSTLSSWFSDQIWSKSLREKLVLKNRDTLKKALQLARSAIINARLKRRSKFIYEARLQFRKLKCDPLFLVGLTAYWGEGNKTNGGVVSFINTDPQLVRVISEFYRKCLHVQNEKLRVGLFIYDDISELEMIQFWSSTLDISKKQFIKTQILKSRSRLTKRRSKYGICSLYFSNTELSIKIVEWIRLLGLEICGSSSVVERLVANE